MSEQLEVLKDVAQRLQKASIPYMVSGSVAMTFYATPRMTRDIDIVVELGTADAHRIASLFSGDFYVDEDDIRECIKTTGIFNIIHNRSVVKIDFIVRKNSEYRLKEFQRRKSVSQEGVDINIVAPEDLILSKLDWAKDSKSELQLRDVHNLISQRKDLDWEYITLWADRLDLTDLLSRTRAP